jgi:hypothetical protein
MHKYTLFFYVHTRLATLAWAQFKAGSFSLSLSLSLSLHQPAIDHLRHPKVKVFSSSKGETFTADHFGGYNS